MHHLFFQQVKRLVVTETEKMYKARKQNEANHRAVRPPLVIIHLPTSCKHFHLESAFLLMHIFGGQLCSLKCSLVAQAICFQAVILLKSAADLVIWNDRVSLAYSVGQRIIKLFIWCVPRNKNFQRRNVVHIFWIFVIWQLAFECFNGALMPSLNSVWDLNIYEAKCPNFSCFWWLFWRMLKSPLYKLQRLVSLFMESMKVKWSFCNLWFLYK